MFSKNYKNYHAELAEVRNRFESIEYICSKEFAQWVDEKYHLVQPKIKEGDKFTIKIGKNERGFKIVNVVTPAGNYWDMSTDLVNTCPQVSYHEPAVGDRFWRSETIWEIYEIDGYDGGVRVRSEFGGTMSLWADEVKDVVWVG